MTCQLCKKQFDQRVDLSRHQCIELHLKLLKKKKEVRKKKWREAHWKRKIDLSYIETTSLTQLSQNIADNLSFCVDGTQEDLKAYSREVKDYLNTELGQETEMEMFLKCSFPEFYDTLTAVSQSGTVSSSSQKNKQKSGKTASQKETQITTQSLDDNHFIRKANSYFANGFYLPSSLTNATNESSNKSVPVPPSLSCKFCRLKCRKIADLVHHQRDAHKLDLKTAFDEYNMNNRSPTNESQNWSTSNMQANSPIGFIACDPFSYVINLHWDQSLKKKCSTCQKMIIRPRFRKHLLECKAGVSSMLNDPNNMGDSNMSSDEVDDDLINNNEKNTQKSTKYNSSNDQDDIIFEPRTESNGISPSISMKVENESFGLNESEFFFTIEF